MKDRNGKEIHQEDIIRGKYYRLDEPSIHTAIVRWGNDDVEWINWDLDTVEIVGNLKNGIQN
jgi:hypothetical protein